MWPFNNSSAVETLPDFINQLLSTGTADLNTALNIATTQGDKIGANCYSTLLGLQERLLSEMGLKPGDKVGVFAMNQILHTLNTNSSMQADILASLQLAGAPMIQRTITDVNGFLTKFAGIVSLAAPLVLAAG